MSGHTSTQEVGARDLEALKQQVRTTLALVSGLQPDVRAKMIDSTERMIDFYDRATDKVEDRRAKLHDLNLTILSISVAALGVLAAALRSLGATEAVKLLALYLAAVLFSQVVVSVFTLVLYLKQSGFRYPFIGDELREFGNRTVWFYYGNQPVRDMKTSPWQVRPGDDKGNQCAYLKGLDSFAAEQLDPNPDKRLKDDIVQLYLRQAHNYYKHSFYLQLVRAEWWRFWGALILAAALTAALLFGRSAITTVVFPSSVAQEIRQRCSAPVDSLSVPDSDPSRHVIPEDTTRDSLGPRNTPATSERRQPVVGQGD